ncbi:Metal-dependent hydrolase, endonuclease/exonuclease/phosphatase family [Salinimicrobium catena]|uniref:Metal-dependent hydrolase, endonuclease/exonuclease/phosphatase family n=1 Tax=Salinimicrobium catena TaxID=390640 RepID=A0A1H5NQ00_9FLAO|nr:endonuclease/exonuclease/phosphatase family protein [Salinimicrobium catena]SDL55222.1 Metal-dependent hydrolase, endonuclease/exonuclease/phosphatase family [Salinimicrobium catena]SEF03633.1 Metal-dependent hydrolase, endonuclease/exonuclease/phosphatase family [Salinimicrobium catena]
MKKSTFLILLFFVQVTLYSQTMEIMTYNIKYLNETDGENSWSQRKDHLTSQIKFYEPGIFGVQEAVLEQLQHIKQNLDGYEYLGEGRDGGQKGEFSAIFFETEKFEKLEEGTFWLSETPTVPSMGWDAAYPRVCTYAKFRNVQNEDEFWVFNTHFDHMGTSARKKSSRMILEKMEEINQQDLPAVLMGDLNLEPDTEEVKFLSAHMEDSKTIANLVFGPEGTFNAYEFQEPVTRRIDYIFLSKGDFKVKKYAVLSDSKDLKYPSDHLPVLVELKLKK